MYVTEVFDVFGKSFMVRMYLHATESRVRYTYAYRSRMVMYIADVLTGQG